jgi:hypothetical protein
VVSFAWGALAVLDTNIVISGRLGHGSPGCVIEQATMKTAVARANRSMARCPNWRIPMPQLIQFPVREERLRAIDILAEAEVGYEGVAKGCYLVSDAVVKLLEANGVRFEVLGDRKEIADAAGS